MKWLFILCFLFSLEAEIVEVQRFSDMSHYITPDALLILDIDDTLILPVQMLGSDSWFLSRLQTHAKEGKSLHQALKITCDEWIAVRHITQMKIVEEGTELIVRNWQAKGFSLMALTSQGLSTAHLTIHHLKANGFDLAKSAPFPTNHYMDLEGHFGHGILYREGILFASGNSKGKTLSLLFQHHRYSPKKIVFIDDKETPLREVEQFAAEKGIEFIGLRYAYADKHKAAYKEEIAEIQLTRSTFKRLLSDEEAADLLKP